MTAMEKIEADYHKAREKWVEANGWMAAHGGSLVWGLAGVVVGFAVGKLF
jgi:hypothetical protein